MKVIYQDTREKPNAVKIINQQIEERGYKIVRNKLFVGDYQMLSNPLYVIDRKQNLNELCGNLCSKDHARIIREFKRANELGIKITILIEDDDVQSIDDVKAWVNPRLARNPRATKGTTLYNTMTTVSWKYEVDFQFCRKKDTGKRIVELLEEHKNNVER